MDINPDVSPQLIPVDFIAPGGILLSCGKCGFNGEVKYLVFVAGPRCFDEVCNCPLPAVFTA